VRVRVQDQKEDATVARDDDGELALCLRTGTVSSRTFVALVLALAPLAQQGHEYLQSAV
jgi:hypothetical protein